MAEFIIGSPLRHVARRHEWLRRLLWRLDHALVWSLVRLFQLLPPDAASRLGARVGALIGPLLRRKEQIFHSNLAVVLPESSHRERARIIREAWRRAGRILAEYPQIGRIHEDPSRLEIDLAGYDPRVSGPCILVAGHLCNWEASLLVMARLGVPFACLYAPPGNPHLDRMLLASRETLGCQLISRQQSARALARALQQERALGIVVDRRVDGGAPLRFFGLDKPSTLLPAKLSLRSGRPLVPIRVQRIRDARFRVTLGSPIVERDPGATEDSRAQDMMQRFHELLEQWIVEDPADWFCSKRIWPKATLAAHTQGQTLPGDG